MVELILLRKERDSPTRCLEMGFHPRQSLPIDYWLTFVWRIEIIKIEAPRTVADWID